MLSHPRSPTQERTQQTREPVSETHRETVRSLVHKVYGIAHQKSLAHVPSGWNAYHDIDWAISDTYREGKQQPVFFLQLRDRLGNTQTIVCKLDGAHMYQEQQQSPTLRRLLPKIHFEIDDVAAIEPVEGLEGGQYSQFFQKHPRFIPLLAQQSIDLCDDLIRAGWYICDINFARGHNIMLDKAGRLRLFDIHSIKKRPFSAEQATLDFFERLFPKPGTTSTDALSQNTLYELRVFAEQIRAYSNKHRTFPRVHRVDTRTITPDDPAYDSAFKELAQTNDPNTIFWIEEHTEGDSELHPQLIAACLNGDLDAIYPIFFQNAKSIFSNVGTPKRTLTC